MKNSELLDFKIIYSLPRQWHWLQKRLIGLITMVTVYFNIIRLDFIMGEEDITKLLMASMVLQDIIWMTEMDELTKDKYVFVIKNYNEFLANDIKEKEEIEDYYESYLLPFWDEEVERVVVEGKRKDFDIYLVSNV